MNWPLLVCISLLILSIIITMIDWMAGVAASACSIVLIIGLMALSIYYHRRINSDMVGFGAGYAQIQKQLLQEMEFPYGVADEIGRLIWMNQSFQRIVQLNNNAHKKLGYAVSGNRQTVSKESKNITGPFGVSGKKNIRSRLRLCRFVILWRRLLMKRIREKRHQ